MFFVVFFSITALFVISYFFKDFFGVAKLLFYTLITTTVFDTLLLYTNKIGTQGARILPEKLSNGDQNSITIQTANRYRFKTRIRIIDEVPIQFQQRNFNITATLKSSEEKQFNYHIRPVKRGEYHFGNVNIYTSSPIGLVERKQTFSKEAMVPNYPSFLQLRKYEFIAFTNKLKLYGLKKIRRIGNTLEFEQIKEYVSGDNIRNINWKATAKRNHLMVNQYQDEKSQPICRYILL